MQSIAAHTLPNGMLVLMCERHSAPIATCWVWYRVGSRYERRGETGISHWAEHMLFKGTPSVPAGALKRLVARSGGRCNGVTTHDYTAYFTTLPADRFTLALQIEADRMINARFDPVEAERERTVILAEREGRENDPTWWLNEAVLGIAFQVHPYRTPVIGRKRDLLALTRDAVYRHYQTYYQPSNAVLVLVGDFTTDTLLPQVEQSFARLPSGSAPPSVRWEEPAQVAARRVVLHHPSPASYVQIGYRTPSCRHPDFAPLLVLDAVLSGAKPPSFSKGAQTNRSARLHRALVETQLAASAHSHYYPTADPRLFEVRATVPDGQSPAAVEAALISEIGRIQQDGVDAAELLKAQTQIRAQTAYAAERMTSQAWLLGMWEMLDRYTRTATLQDELRAVSADDIRRVAQTYLVERYRTVGHLRAVPSWRQCVRCSPNMCSYSLHMDA